ncbi:MAG: hypothetical protein MZV63_18630 [Marinilabiliales bacterium]|nr:hypothetical protein [Marinilabiliales bacterium]
MLMKEYPDAAFDTRDGIKLDSPYRLGADTQIEHRTHHSHLCRGETKRTG